MSDLIRTIVECNDGSKEEHEQALLRRLKEITKTAPEYPICLLDLDHVTQLVQRWRNLFPEIRAYYPVRCLNVKALLKHFSQLKTNFTCSSSGEIADVVAAGADPKHIFFDKPVKFSEDMAYAAKMSVGFSSFHSRCEIDKHTQFWPNCQLFLTIDDFELLHDTNDTADLLHYAKDHGLPVCGISLDFNEIWGEDRRRSISQLRHLIERAKAMGHRIKYVDLGCILPISLDSEDLGLVNDVVKDLKDLFPNISTLDLISRSGEYFVNSAGTFVCRVTGKKEMSTQTLIYLNDGTYGSFINRVSFLGLQALPAYAFRNGADITDQVIPKGIDNTGLHDTRLFGPTCDATDVLVTSIYLGEIQYGDYLAWRHMGAFTVSVRTFFNSTELVRLLVFCKCD